ncbi:hypothetical protein Ae168Ps1_2535 [Pseudonocardia sp. Ae168_Ps1]|nr:hypothetical protein Ae168Ps1_2535 [Pseudonocardia sp. Ae168_Ps1]
MDLPDPAARHRLTGTGTTNSGLTTNMARGARLLNYRRTGHRGGASTRHAHRATRQG